MTAGAVAGDDMRTDRPDPCDDVCMAGHDVLWLKQRFRG